MCCDSKFILFIFNIARLTVIFLPQLLVSSEALNNGNTMTTYVQGRQSNVDKPILVHVEFEVFGGVQGKVLLFLIFNNLENIPSGYIMVINEFYKSLTRKEFLGKRGSIKA